MLSNKDPINAISKENSLIKTKNKTGGMITSIVFPLKTLINSDITSLIIFIKITYVKYNIGDFKCVLFYS